MSLTRRRFAKMALGASASTACAPLLTACRAGDIGRLARRGHDRDTVLVVIQLSGGNDGLNTLVPYADDEYARNRPTLRLAAKEVHKVDAYLGFHPRMGGFARLFKKGELSVIQGVGAPNLSRDHEAAMRAWHTGDPDKLNRQTGWVGRTADTGWTLDRIAVIAAFVGSIPQPFAMNAEQVIVPSLRTLDDVTISGLPDHSDGRRGLMREASRSNPGQENSLHRFVRTCMAETHAVSQRIRALAEANAGASDYPAFGLAADLRTIAQLIRAETGIRIFCAELGGGGIGGFDNHANQLGNHCAVLHQLSESVAAFVDDLRSDGRLERVLLMTFSEFGRTLKENGRRGTGHGVAAPVFLAGGKLKGGLVGPHPSLTDLDNGALRYHTDFRQVYATALERWLGFDSHAILGRQFEPLDVFDA